MSALYRVYARLIELATTETEQTSLKSKIDVAYAINRITDDEYTALMAMFPTETTETGV